MKLDASKPNYAIRLTADDLELFNEFIALHEESTEKELPNIRVAIMAAVESALSKKKPIEVSRKEDLQTIANLTAEVENLKNSNENYLHQNSLLRSENTNLQAENERLQSDYELRTTDYNIATADFTELRTENTQLQQNVNELKTYIQLLQDQPKTSKTAENEVVVQLNDFQMHLFNTLLANRTLAEKLRKQNDNGKLSGLIDVIDTPDRKQNLANLLTTATVGSAAGRIFYPVVSRSDIQKAFVLFKRNG